ncbi:MAG: hypothetical protein RLZZ241_566 [Bacteroidota bacterium]|jgi:SAM-dependent methyltransferase
MEYDHSIALHYAAYRPALHGPILRGCLEQSTFNLGVDIGCGTGQSAIALANYCKGVIGFEPSRAMLQHAVTHPKVLYQNSFAEIREPFDLLCYFGSLEYVCQLELEKQLAQLQVGGTLICCDFEVDLEPLLALFDVCLEPSNYNHEKNLSNYGNFENYALEKQHQVSLSFTCTLPEGLHLLLSSKSLYALFKTVSGGQHPDDFLAAELLRHFSTGTIGMQAKGFYTRYQKQ